MIEIKFLEESGEQARSVAEPRKKVITTVAVVLTGVIMALPLLFMLNFSSVSGLSGVRGQGVLPPSFSIDGRLIVSSPIAP